MSTFLMLSHEAAGLPLAYRLQEEGHDVQVFIEERKQKGQYRGLLPQVQDWEVALTPETIVVFDGVGFGLKKDAMPETEDDWNAYRSIGDELREEGYRVIGGSTFADRIELDRPFGAKVAKEEGLLVPTTHPFEDFADALKFVKETQQRYILKPSGNQPTFDLYPAEDWKDMVDYLQDAIDRGDEGPMELQEFVDGQQLSCEGYWTGKKFVSINHTFEHKPQLSTDVGPFTGETGSLIYWTPEGQEDKHAEATVLKLTERFKEEDVAPGPFDVNCIVNEEGAWFLEFTARFGYPALYLQMYATESPWGDALEQLADGRFTGFQIKPFHWFLCGRVWIPKWPYGEVEEKFQHRALFSRVRDEHLEQISFVDVMQNGKLRVAGADGELMCVSAAGNSINEVRGKLYQVLNEVYLYPMGWRSDLGVTALDQLPNLIRWGYYVSAER